MGRIEISIYLTAKVKEDDLNNIMVQDVGAEQDTITTLRAPTHFGRPNWDRVFPSISDKHHDTDVGVFFCGPSMLSKTCVTMIHFYPTWSNERCIITAYTRNVTSTLTPRVPDSFSAKVCSRVVKYSALLRFSSPPSHSCRKLLSTVVFGRFTFSTYLHLSHYS